MHIKRPASLFYLLFSLFYLLFSNQPAHAADLKEIFSGYYKFLGAISKAVSTKESIYYALQRLRLEFKPKLTKNVETNFTYDHEALLNDFARTSDFNLIRQKNQKNLAWWDADKVISDAAHFYERHLLHRAYVKFTSPHSAWTFGKQLIDWGRMRFYSPLDLFNQPIPSDIEADERVGFDALNMEFSDENFSGINILYGPGHNTDEDSYGLRLYKKIATYDTFLLAAKHGRDKVAGIGFDGYIKDAGFRGEFSYTRSAKEEYPRFSLGLDYTFAAKTTLVCEYFYNGAANGNINVFSNSIIEQRKRLSLEKNLLSSMLTREITPLLKFKALAIYDIAGKSAFLNPELRYNVKQDLDIAAGCQLFFESPGSEFENSQNLYYAELKLFF
jgi:hypothetical protein